MKKSPIRINSIQLLFFILLLGFTAVTAQTENSDKYVTIDSRPSGAVVHLEGEYQFIGRTPFVVPYTVIGKYDIKASKLGYQGIQRSVTFSGNAPSEVQLRLSPKTRLKSFSRSFIIPGWGQYYSDRKLVGSLYAGVTAVSVIFLLKSQQDYMMASRDYENVLGKSELGGFSYQDRVRLLNEVDNEWKDLQKAEDVRNANLLIVAGVWALNMIDSFFFFPNYSRDIDVFEKLSFNALPLHDGVGLSLNYTLN